MLQYGSVYRDQLLEVPLVVRLVVRLVVTQLFPGLVVQPLKSNGEYGDYRRLFVRQVAQLATSL